MILEGLVIPIKFDPEELSKGLDDIWKSLADIVGPTALGKLYIDFLGDAIEEAGKSEVVNARLATALHATGREAQMSFEQFDALSVSLSKVSAFDDESIKSAFQVLSQFPTIDTGSIESITKAAMDLSAAMGGDLTANAEAIGRALETGVIPRTWGFNQALKDQFKAQTDAGQSAAALTTLMDGLNSRYGGQAQAQIGTYNGQMMLLKNNWDNFKENIGNQYIPGLAGLLQWINKNFEAISIFANAVYKVFSPLQTLIDLANQASKAISSVNTTVYNVPSAGYTPPKKTSPGRASGGPASGLTWVGERGPELINLPSGSQVNNNQASTSMGFDYYKLAAILAVEFAKIKD
jgi:hypothetical protein